MGDGTGGEIMNELLAQGKTGTDALNFGNDYMQNLAQEGAPQFQYDQGTFDTTMQNLAPAMQGTYDDMTRDITRDLNYSTLPGLNIGAAMGGNMASSSLANNSTLATGFANDRMADIGSQIYQNAVTQANTNAYGAGGKNLDATQGTSRDIMNTAGNYAGRGLPGYVDAQNTGVKNIGLENLAGDQYWQQPQNDATWQSKIANASAFPGAAPVGNNTFGNIVQGAQVGAGLWDSIQGNQQPAQVNNPNPYGYSYDGAPGEQPNWWDDIYGPS